MDLLGRKSVKALASQMNEGAASKPSDWAKRMLQKHGWTEGKGLGKAEQGMTTHIKAKKKDDTNAIGYDAVKQGVTQDLWMKSMNVFNGMKAAPIGGKAAVSAADSDSESEDEKPRKAKAARKRARDDSDSDSSSDSDSDAAPAFRIDRKGGAKATGGMSSQDAAAALNDPDQAQDFYKSLYEATGGARLGMRARAKQSGKWSRAEQGVVGKAPVATAHVLQATASTGTHSVPHPAPHGHHVHITRKRSASESSVGSQLGAAGRRSRTNSIASIHSATSSGAQHGLGSAEGGRNSKDSGDKKSKKEKKEKKSKKEKRAE